MNRTASAIRDSINKINASANVSVLPCRIIKVNKDNMTADVYLQETSSTITNVPFCFPSKGKGYGSYFMPRENATYLLMYSSKMKPYILTYAPISVSLDGLNTNNEKLMPGENLVQSYGNAYSKQDVVGHNIQSSQFGNTNIQDANGVNQSMSLGYQSNTIASKNINGFALMQNACKDREYLNQSTIKVLDYTEYYSQVGILKVYKPDEIISYSSNGASIDQVIRQNIIEATKTCLDKIDLFKTTIITCRDQIEAMTLSDTEVASAISNAYAELRNFNLERKGVRIVVEKGNALNDRLGNISDVTKLKSSDFAKNGSIDIVYRMTVLDVLTDTIKGMIFVDAEGNCNLNFKSVYIDSDTFTTTAPIETSDIIDGGNWDEE